MRHWLEFQPRSLCSFGDGNGDSTGGPSGDTAGTNTSGDFFGDTTSNADFFGTGPDTTGGPTANFTGPESSNISNADFFGGGPTFSTDTTGGPSFTSDTSGPTFSDSSGTGFYSSDMGPSIGADFGQFQGDYNMSPTGGVDFTGGGLAFGPGGPGQGSYFGTDVSSQFGPTGNYGPATSNMSPDDFSAMTAHSPGYVAPGDPMGNPNPASVGQQFGQPNMSAAPEMTPSALDARDVGEQGKAGRDAWIGGPTISNPLEAFPGGRGERSDVGPNFFGPENVNPQTTAANQSGWGSFFGPSAAQAASRGTDQGMISQDVLAGVNVAGRAASELAQTDPALAQALSGWASNLANIQSGGMVGPGMAGWYGGPPGQTGPFDAPSPGAQQGFTGVSPAQASFQSFTGQPSLSGVSPFSNEQAQGKGDRGATEQTQQTNPNMNLVDPMVAQQGYQQLSAEMNAQQAQQAEMRGPTVDPALQTALETRAAEMRGPDFNPNINPTPDPALQTALEDRAAEMRGPTDRGPTDDPNIIETIARSGPEIMTGLIGPETRGVGREAAPLGLLSMMDSATRGVGREAAPFGLQTSPFGPQSIGRDTTQSGSRGSTQSTQSRSGNPLSITVGPNQFSGQRGGPGYYATGGRGIAPGAKGAEYGGMYGPGVATGRAGTNTFGIDSRSGAFGTFDPYTGIYYGGGRR